MKVIVSGRRLIRRPAIIASALVIVLCFSLFFFFGNDDSAEASLNAPLSKTAAQDDAITVSAVLGTLEYYGALDVEQALTVWSEGVAARNGVAQYSVMSDDLKGKYLELLGDNMMFPSGSARVDGWYISEVNETEGITVAKIRFNITGGVSEVAAAELQLEQDGPYVVVSSVAVETALYEFTGIG